MNDTKAQYKEAYSSIRIMRSLRPSQIEDYVNSGAKPYLKEAYQALIASREWEKYRDAHQWMRDRDWFLYAKWLMKYKPR